MLHRRRWGVAIGQLFFFFTLQAGLVEKGGGGGGKGEMEMEMRGERS